jgi:glycosyltransferase involved in cell wall biosynthesis
MTLSITAPKVSVCVITYNQEQYIRQCLQSIVDQDTNFAFEVIVGEDCSTDGTRLIVQEFEKRYPGIVKPIYQEKNIGGGCHNFLTVHDAAVGEYIAHVDGDDYCLPGKLQAQADLLDMDSGCNIVFHRMLILSPNGEIREGPLQHVRKIAEMRFDRSKLLKYTAIGSHSSKMYRKVFRHYELPDFDIVDFFSHVEQVGKGYARFTGHESLGVYRLGGALSSSDGRSREALARSYIYFCKKYPQYRLQINTGVLVFLIADLKNSRQTWRAFFLAWIQTFHAYSIPNLLWSLRFINRLRT